MQVKSTREIIHYLLLHRKLVLQSNYQVAGGYMITPSVQKTGKLYLVGAGPGDADLLTMQAYRLITTATTVVYDRLVSDEIMALLPVTATKIYVGKAPGKHHMPQEQINELIVDLALKGTDVVRLKGGDPYIFGRGGEEALILTDHNIPIEVVPGITTAQAVSTRLGIPLTHRGLATSVRYITGCCAGELKGDMDWKGLADRDTTLVAYMGLSHAGEIADNLIEQGMPASTPAALIENATRSNEKFVTTTLGKLVQTIQGEGFKPPTIIMIGRVVGLADQLNFRRHLSLEQELAANG